MSNAVAALSLSSEHFLEGSLLISVACLGWLMNSQVMENSGYLERFPKEDLQDTEDRVLFYSVLDSALSADTQL